ncbi:ABC transporter substrate-binding protein [Roseomonas sp. JC162]|uniref:ABC transporter substrate-binding protein n=1 Tax=Neoroseomonas marina TaxID=1232220 RepID=A0A848EH62_9PROT|nr:ABC transporter substrate-binding protein [Neoroseomonas marina]NMJ42949.1 ABC transporter substrate-binding protein [Neoroseomonas marina]
MADAPLSTALGRYPGTAALIDGHMTSPLFALAPVEVKPISRAFAPMVRALRFDVSEMAIVTFLMAKAWAKDLVLLPVAVVARFQEAALLCRADGSVSGPGDLRGKRVGVRAYSQTTGLWLRGRMQDAFGIAPEDNAWVTFEDAHVAEYGDPPFVARAAPGEDMLAMLRSGALDAAIFGNDVPADAGLRTVFDDPAAAGRDFVAAHGFVPVNHLVVVRGALVRERPDVVAALTAMLREAAGEAGLPHGRPALEPALALAIRYAREQGLLPRDMAVDEAWDGLPAGIG